MLSHFLMNGLLPKSSSWSAMIYVSLGPSGGPQSPGT